MPAYFYGQIFKLEVVFCMLQKGIRSRQCHTKYKKIYFKTMQTVDL